MEIVEIPFGSFIWYLQMTANVSFIALLVLIGVLLPKRIRFRYGELIGFSLLFFTFITQFYLDTMGVWSIRALPFELCNFISFAAVIALYTRNQWAYELCLFVGIVGPFQAFITPAVFQGGDNIIMAIFFLTHSLIIFTPFYLTFVVKMRPRAFAWFKTPTAFASVIVPTLMSYNMVFETNHMFLAQRPIIDHPMNFGQWPLYIVLWFLILLGFSFLISLLFRQNETNSESLE